MKLEDLVIPDDRYYTEDHEWALPEDDASVRVGVTDYAVQRLNEVVFVETPTTGIEVARAMPIGTVESVKAVSEVFSPVTGTVIDSNEALALSPELVNQDPYGRGWIAVITSSDLPRDLSTLLDRTAYAAHVKHLLA
jgi:glycine cleavage system H protein